MTDKQQAIIQTIREGGAGGEAEIWLQARNTFPGIGGIVVTSQLVAAAWRKEYSPLETIGESLFLKHVIVKKLDDYFCRTGRYTYPHVARPLGSERNTYFYEWVWGATAFPWVETAGSGVLETITLAEWSEFVSAFDEAGISVGHDAADPDNANVSQNIVHQVGHSPKEGKLDLFWKRIDFGSRSLPIDYDKLGRYVDLNGGELKAVLGDHRYWLLVYALKALQLGQELNVSDRVRLEELVAQYRISSLRQNRPRLSVQ